MTWTITNYVNNNSNGNQFTPYKPQERKKEEDVFSCLLFKQQCIEQQHVKLLYQFARGDDCYQNTDHRYIMQLTREISGFNYSPYEAGL